MAGPNPLLVGFTAGLSTLISGRDPTVSAPGVVPDPVVVTTGESALWRWATIGLTATLGFVWLKSRRNKNQSHARPRRRR